jgi:putative ABC transport system permease protein
MTHWVDGLRADLRYATRQLLGAPTFTLVAAATLALGIGATTAIFSIVNAVILQPLPFPDPDRVVVVEENFEGGVSSVSGGNFNDWRTRARSFSELAAFHRSSFNVAPGDAPERVLGARTTHNFFAVFGISPLLGRTYTADEDRPGGGDVAVLSHRLWTRQFAADPRTIGSRVRMDGREYIIVGVMPPGFDRMAAPEELWVPVAFTQERLAEHDEHFLTVVARLAPGVSIEQARAELQAIYRQMQTELPGESQVRLAAVNTLMSQLVGDVRERLLVLFGAVTFVLLIACGNVAHLLLARGGIRAHEMAVRRALGAGRARVVRQLLTETLALALLGGALGVAVAYVAVPLLVRLSPDGVPRLDQAAVNGPVLVFALIAAIVSALIAGLTPAIATASQDLRSAINEGGRTAIVSRERLRFVLVTVEVGVALVLLAGAGLLVRSALRLQEVNPGFEARGVLAARLTLPATGYDDPARIVRTFDEIAHGVSSAPGIEAVALTSSAPMGNEARNGNSLVPEGKALDASRAITVQLTMIGRDYLDVMRIPLIRGRSFTDADRRDAPLVMMLNETAARRLFPGEDPLGKQVACCESGPGDAPVFKIVVGIVGDVRAWGLREEAPPQFYVPMAQAPPVAWSWIQRSMTLVARARTLEPSSLTAVLRRAVQEIDPTVPLYNVATMDERLATTLAATRFNTVLMLVLGTSGLLLAAIGIYGVITFMVAQRQRDIAIRVALGAPARDVVRMVIVQGMRPVLIGIIMGTAIALAASRVLTSYVFGITTRDPLTMAVVIAVFIATALVAAAIPARRAANVDPARALLSI